MKRPGFLQGVCAAAVAAFLAGASVASLTTFVGVAAAVRLVIPLLGLAYILYLFSRNDERTGRITTIGAWLLVSMASWWLVSSLPAYLLVHVALIWLVRCLYFYAGVIPALLDLGLTLLSIAAASWAMTRSGSFFLATWCFFLVQALFSAIPGRVGRSGRATQAPPAGSQRFDAARQQAERALKQLWRTTS
jgi:hypothetical protein